MPAREEMLRPAADMIFTVENRQEMALVRNGLLPVVRLYQKFGVEPRSEVATESLLIVAEVAGKSAGRLLGFGTVMLQDVEASIREAARIKQIGLLGVEIGSNVNGLGLDDPLLFDFYAAMQDLDLSLMIHPHNVAGQERMGEYHLRATGPGRNVPATSASRQAST